MPGTADLLFAQATRIGMSCSVLDFMHLGSSLALRSFATLGSLAWGLLHIAEPEHDEQTRASSGEKKQRFVIVGSVQYYCVAPEAGETCSE